MKSRVSFKKESDLTVVNVQKEFDRIYSLLSRINSKIGVIGTDQQSSGYSGDVAAVNEADTNTLKNKVVSNNLAYRWEDAYSKKHDRQHAIDASADHTSTITENNLIDADANGLPDDSGLAVADVSDAVSKKHTQNTDTQLDSGVVAVDGSDNVTIGDGTNYAKFETDGTLEFNGDATVFDDLQVDISNVKLPTSSAPTWRDYNHGVGGGVTFPVLGFDVGEYMYFNIQTKHSMKLSTVLDNHIHYMTPTDGTGDKFKFQLDVIAAPINGNWAVPTGSPFTKEVTMVADLSNSHKIEDLADIPAVNTTVSTLYKYKLTRIAATADEYSGEVYVEFADCHFEKNTLGSRSESSK